MEAVLSSIATTRATGEPGASVGASKGRADARTAQHEVEVPWAAGPGLRRSLGRWERCQTRMKSPVSPKEVSNVSSFRAEKSGS